MMLPGLRRPAVPEPVTVCYKSFSFIFGGDGAGGTDELVVLEFFAVALSSSSWDFSLVLGTGFDVEAPLFGVCCVF